MPEFLCNCEIVPCYSCRSFPGVTFHVLKCCSHLVLINPVKNKTCCTCFTDSHSSEFPIQRCYSSNPSPRQLPCLQRRLTCYFDPLVLLACSNPERKIRRCVPGGDGAAVLVKGQPSLIHHSCQNTSKWWPCTYLWRAIGSHTTAGSMNHPGEKWHPKL